MSLIDRRVRALAVAALCAAAPRAAVAHDRPIAGVVTRTSVMPASLARALYWNAARIPSFSRQTRLPCSACHYQFPQLTPFGRLFKLNGYTLTGLTAIQSGGDTTRRSTLELAPIPPASAMFVVSTTHLQTGAPRTQNNTAVFPQQASVFLAGEVTPRIGAFTQFTYTAADAAIGIDNVDLRFADHATLGNRDVIFGLTLHNNPTVQDVWNTAPAWGYPFMASATSPSPIAATLLDGTLGQQVVGLGAYGLWDGALYTELTAYRSAPQGAAGALDSAASGVIRTASPYWRVALQHQFGVGYLMVGTYGMTTRLYPTGVSGATDRYTDVAADAQFERGTGTPGGVVILRGAYIHERQHLAASAAAEPATASEGTGRLGTTRLSASYLPNTTVGVTLAYFNTSGRVDTLRYARAPVIGSASGSPNTDGGSAELTLNPWQNTRLGVQYVAYRRFNGGRGAYDGAGRRAADNNTLFLYTWIAF